MVQVFDETDGSDEDEDTDWDAYIEVFTTGRIRDFIEVAPDLRTLGLGFDEINDGQFEYPLQLFNVLEGHTWTRLRTLNLKAVGTQQVSLLSFFKSILPH